MRIIMPIISALLFRFGGSDQWTWCKLNQKWWRWGMGLPIFLFYGKYTWLTLLLTISTFFTATNCFGYGEKTPILKYLPQDTKHLVSGMIFGLATFPLIGWWSISQAFISGTVFYLVETKKINNPLAELLRGGSLVCLLF